MKTYNINGTEVKSWYEGIDAFSVGGKVCHDLETLARWCEVDVETLKDEMWRQR